MQQRIFIVLFLSGYSLMRFKLPTWLLFSFVVGSLKTIFLLWGSDLFLVGTGPIRLFATERSPFSVQPHCVLFFVAVATVCFGNFQRGEGLTIGVACLDLRFSVFGASGGTFGALASGCVLL